MTMIDDTKGPSAEALRFIDEISLCPHADEILAWAFAFDAFAAQAIATTPIDAVLFCPACGVQHIDQPQREKGWSNPAHKTHECQGCGHLWRPSSTPTNGVADVALGTSDTRPAVRGVAAARERPLSADLRALLQRCADALRRYATDYPAQPDALHLMNVLDRICARDLTEGCAAEQAKLTAHVLEQIAHEESERLNLVIGQGYGFDHSKPYNSWRYGVIRKSFTAVIAKARREGEIAMRERCVLAAQKVLATGGTREAALDAIRSLSPEGETR